ncbi:P-loop containing nucleoside triphosphate hydrolase protein [Halenospora varia]|nr:P-loop containing nucleoside triphosphate hydrolase protein [Halenospora varia]
MKTIPHIAFVGPTGVGKTSLLNLCAGQTAGTVGHDWKSCTQEVQRYECEVEGSMCVLLDSPGFNDTFQSDEETLIKLARYLEITYRRDQKLTALFYLIDITQSRMTGSALQNLDLFRKLCGRDCLENVIFVTTKWDEAKKSKAEKNEQELRNEFLHEMISLGACVARHDNTPESAAKLLNSVLSLSPTVTRIQKELVDEDKKLQDTDAGREISQKNLERIEQLEKKCKEMEKRHIDTLQGQAETNEAEMNKIKGIVEKLREENEKLQQYQANKSSFDWMDLCMQGAQAAVQELGSAAAGAISSKLRASGSSVKTPLGNNAAKMPSQVQIAGPSSMAQLEKKIQESPSLSLLAKMGELYSQLPPGTLPC